MKDAIMLASSVLFGVLFSFLALVFSVFVASRFFNRSYKSYEPKLSIVIPAYNEEKNIEECINSILESDYPKEKMELIIADDGSTDSTLKLLRKYKKIKVLKQNHLGKVEALNLGCKKSSSEFILTIDADTILDKDCIKELLNPFSDKNIGATTGNNNVRNKKSIIGAFQNVEYHFSNLIRNSFSKVFNNGIWFSGSLACYRKTALENIGYFKKDTLAEDQDIALEMKKAGYKTINASTAFGYTIVPAKIMELYRQRARWWIGTLQSIVKNKSLFSRKASPSILFLYINQFWWSFYAFLSLPLIIYQINYWLPYNSQSLYSMLSYFFKWFSLMGPVYVIYRIPDFGVSIYSIFGVLSGIMTTILSVAALKMFRDSINLRNMLAIFFYFPYTIVLNIIILVSLLKHRFWARSYYIK
ncbi:glycosyltransferase family 2 protein [Candidatus Woesearchaeota archaeon]|nr:glycosyltransferase family 2 protein [Candidatus Woesearchaeota archaeon]